MFIYELSFITVKRIFLVESYSNALSSLDGKHIDYSKKTVLKRGGFVNDR